VVLGGAILLIMVFARLVLDNRDGGGNIHRELPTARNSNFLPVRQRSNFGLRVRLRHQGPLGEGPPEIRTNRSFLVFLSFAVFYGFDDLRHCSQGKC